jgi:hypothetical protein
MRAKTNSGGFVETNDGTLRCRMVPSSKQADQDEKKLVDLLRWILSLKASIGGKT